jgi:hypothetical protein
LLAGARSVNLFGFAVFALVLSALNAILAAVMIVNCVSHRWLSGSQKFSIVLLIVTVFSTIIYFILANVHAGVCRSKIAGKPDR